MRNAFYITGLFFLAGTFTFCNSIKKVTEKYDQLKVYCWCFSHGNEIVNKDGTKSRNPGDYQCQTFVRVKPQDIIRPENLSDSITNQSQLARISEMLMKGYSDTIMDNPKPDARFVLVLRDKAGEEQRITYSNDYNLVFNEQYSLNYKFNVMDSLKKLLGKSRFHCPD